MTDQKPPRQCGTLEIPVSDIGSKVVQTRAVVGAANAFAKVVKGPEEYAAVLLSASLIYELQMAGVPPENCARAIADLVNLQLPIMTEIVQADMLAMDQAEAAEAVKQ